MKIINIFSVFMMCIFAVLLFSFQPCFAEENPCLTCHGKIKQPAKSVHAAIALGCSSCHKSVEGKTHPGQKGSIILTQSMPGLCYSCHDEKKFMDQSVHQPVQTGMCTGCHDAHQSNYPKILLKDSPGLCYNCHDESRFKGGSGHTNLGMCTGCHNPHASKVNKILNATQPDLCYTCHDKAQFIKKYVHSIIPVGGCTSCHTPHVSKDPSLLTQSIYDLCVSCHANKSDGRHVVAIPGKRIHPVAGVVDPSTTTIIQIVDPANQKKSRLGPDPNNPGKLMTCTSCHDPHSSEYSNLFPTNQLCKKCHKEY